MVRWEREKARGWKEVKRERGRKKWGDGDWGGEGEEEAETGRQRLTKIKDILCCRKLNIWPGDISCTVKHINGKFLRINNESISLSDINRRIIFCIITWYWYNEVSRKGVHTLSEYLSVTNTHHSHHWLLYYVYLLLLLCLDRQSQKFDLLS